jgi:hypothetical protein
MRLRQLQSRLGKLERLAVEHAEAESEFTIDQAIADRYCELQSQVEKLVADHEAGLPVDLDRGYAQWSEMIEIRNTNNLRTNDLAYRHEIRARKAFLKKRKEDPNYIPLSSQEEAHLRQLTLLCNICFRDLLGAVPAPLEKHYKANVPESEDMKRFNRGIVALKRVGDDFSSRNNHIFEPIDDRYKAKLERFRKK